jgi:hypothetical protein
VGRARRPAEEGRLLLDMCCWWWWGSLLMLTVMVGGRQRPFLISRGLPDVLLKEEVEEDCENEI